MRTGSTAGQQSGATLVDWGTREEEEDDVEVIHRGKRSARHQGRSQGSGRPNAKEEGRTDPSGSKPHAEDLWWIRRGKKAMSWEVDPLRQKA